MGRPYPGFDMRISAIDIGTNTVLLLVADVDKSGTITPLLYEQRIPRLGKDVDARKVIGRAAFERVAGVLREYKRLSQKAQAEHLVAVGTSAVRDAANRDEFLAYIKQQTGIDVEVVSGKEEAELAYLGALSGVQTTNKHFAVIDIGGGSTEVTAGTRENILANVSLDIGSVRLTERFLRHDPPTPQEFQDANDFIVQALHSLPEFDFPKALVIGVAGTATTLAVLDQGLKEFNRAKIANYRLTKPAVTNLLNKLKRMKTEEILAISAVTHGRADILTAGSLILHTFMEQSGIEAIVVSERGVRYGLVLRQWRK